MDVCRATKIKILDRLACFIISCASDLGTQGSHEHHCNDTGKGNTETEAKISSWTYPSVISQNRLYKQSRGRHEGLTRDGFSMWVRRPFPGEKVEFLK